MRRVLYDDAWAVDPDAEAAFRAAMATRAATIVATSLVLGAVVVGLTMIVIWGGYISLLGELFTV